MSRGLPRAAHHYPDAVEAYGLQAGREDAREGKPSRAWQMDPGGYRAAYERGYAEEAKAAQVKP